MALEDKSIEQVATRDLVGRTEPGEHVFVTATDKGFYLKERKRGETFSVPRSLIYDKEGNLLMSGRVSTWFVPASEGDIRRTNEAVEADMASVLSSPRYERPNSPEAARAANAARADSVKAQQGPVEHTETPEEKAARLQAAERASTDQAERDRLAAEENANRNREQSQTNANASSPAARTSPEQAEKLADASVEIGRLRDEAAKLEAAGGKDNKRKAQELREQANKLEQGGDLA